jgi:hypothetical protein
MKKVVAIMMSGLAALALAASLGAPAPAAQRAPAAPAGASAALITAWRCPITDQFFASPFTCKNNCFGFTCQAVSQ